MLKFIYEYVIKTKDKYRGYRIKMSIKLRSLITIITHIFLIKSVYSIVKGEPINLFFLLMGVVGISYLIITNDYYNEKQTKRNSRKILSNSGKLIEHPEFIKYLLN